MMAAFVISPELRALIDKVKLEPRWQEWQLELAPILAHVKEQHPNLTPILQWQLAGNILSRSRCFECDGQSCAQHSSSPLHRCGFTGSRGWCYDSIVIEHGFVYPILRKCKHFDNVQVKE